MLDRINFFHRYQIKFSDAFKKAIEGFTVDEEIHITETLLAVLECYKENPVNSEKAQKIHEELYKKYRKRLMNYNSYAPSEFFAEKSMRQVDLQYELKMEKAGHEETLFTEEERQQFLKETEKFLKLRKQMLYLLSEPVTENKEQEGAVKTKGKIKRERDDNRTSLNQEQTALFIYCLQKTKIILNGEFLKNKEAGQAFSMLTGYSADTLRQNLNKSELARIASIKNSDAVLKALKDLQKFIQKEIQPER